MDKDHSSIKKAILYVDNLNHIGSFNAKKSSTEKSEQDVELFPLNYLVCICIETKP